MNYLMALLAMLHSAVLASSIMDVPSCTLFDQVFLALKPGSLMRLGLTCKPFKDLATAALMARFTKIRDGQRVLDIELLYDIYHDVDEEKESEEKIALQRLIEANYPVIEGSPKLQNHYETFKSQLFYHDAIPTITEAYQEFPEVSRMLLKHKETVGRLRHLSLLKSPFTELSVKRMITCPDYVFLQIMHLTEPKEVEHLFPILHDMPESTRTILTTRDPAFLLEDRQTITPIEATLVCCMIEELEEELVFEILEKFCRTNNVSEGLLTALHNWMTHEHMKPVCIKRFEIGGLSSHSTCHFALLMGRPETVAPIEFYRALRGYEEVDSIFEFLQSHDEETQAFTGVVPDHASNYVLFEAALHLGVSDDVLRSIMRFEGFEHGKFLTMLSILKGRSPSIIIELMKTPLLPDQHFTDLSCKMDVHPEVFSHIVHHYEEQPMSCFSILSCGALNPDNQLANWKTLLDTGLFPNPSLYVINAQVFSDFERSEEMITMFTAYAFKYNFCCFWKINEYFEGDFKGSLAFYDSLPLESLLAYIPTELKKEDDPADAYSKFHSFGNIVGSSYFLAVRSVLTRPGGYEALRKHFPSHEDFSALMLFAGHPEVDYMACLKPLSERADALVQWISAEPEFAPKAHKFFKYLCDSADNEEAMKFLILFYNRCTEANVPLLELFPLHHLDDKHLDVFLTNNNHGVSVLSHDYYGPRLAKFYAGKNMIENVVQVLVKKHSVTSFADISQSWPHLIPYLDQDPAVTDEIIRKINSDENITN